MHKLLPRAWHISIMGPYRSIFGVLEVNQEDKCARYPVAEAIGCQLQEQFAMFSAMQVKQSSARNQSYPST